MILVPAIPIIVAAADTAGAICPAKERKQQGKADADANRAGIGMQKVKKARDCGHAGTMTAN